MNVLVRKIAVAPERQPAVRPLMVATLRRGARVWAIGSVHGHAASLKALHAAIAAKLEADDRLIYLGNG